MNKSRNVFISWSGERSRHVAEALRVWLPKVVQAAKPWMSETDIEKGSRGLNELSKALEGIKIGIACLTPENLPSPWILFEAGALSKTIDDNTRLCTYLLGGLQPQDVKAPLGLFQATRAIERDTQKLVRAINRALSDDPIPEQDLDDLFTAMWPMLEEKLKAMPEPEHTVPAPRPIEDMVAEILEMTRDAANRRRKLDHFDAYIPLFDELAPFLQEALRAARQEARRQSLLATPRQGPPGEVTMTEPILPLRNEPQG